MKTILSELHVRFGLGLNEDYSPGDSTSVALRNRSREVGGLVWDRKVSTHVILVKRKFVQFSTYLSRTFLLISRSFC